MVKLNHMSIEDAVCRATTALVDILNTGSFVSCSGKLGCRCRLAIEVSENKKRHMLSFYAMRISKCCLNYVMMKEVTFDTNTSTGL